MVHLNVMEKSNEVTASNLFHAYNLEIKIKNLHIRLCNFVFILHKMDVFHYFGWGLLSA